MELLSLEVTKYMGAIFRLLHMPTCLFFSFIISFSLQASDLETSLF